MFRECTTEEILNLLGIEVHKEEEPIIKVESKGDYLIIKNKNFIVKMDKEKMEIKNK